MNTTPLHHEDKAAIKSVAHLHRTLLPTSPVAKLGSAFLERFYYSRFLKDALLNCDYYRYDGKIVGFITYTKRPFDLLKIGLSKNFFYLCGFMLFLFVRRPHKIIETLGVLRLNTGIQSEDKHQGAILSFGVLPEYRNRKFIDKTGTYISHELFRHTFDFFRKDGISKLRMLVEPDNREALLFYHTYGCKFQKVDLMGKPLMQVTYTIH